VASHSTEAFADASQETAAICGPINELCCLLARACVHVPACARTSCPVDDAVIYDSGDGFVDGMLLPRLSGEVDSGGRSGAMRHMKLDADQGRFS
jgi:hypothetical protein